MTDSPSPDGADASDDLPINDGIRAALALLERALECAQDAQAHPWDFGLEIGQLYAAGLTITDLRWLVVKEFVEHADETSAHGDERRSFKRRRGLTFLPTTCVVLTNKGAALAARAKARDEGPAASASPRPPTAPKPRWDAARRELVLGDRMVKRFRVPARNQELVLSAFQDADWPESIDDPLADEFDIDPKIRLNDVVYRLNHKQLARLVRFHVNGCGSRVYWSLHASPAMPPHPSAGVSSSAM